MGYKTLFFILFSVTLSATCHYNSNDRLVWPFNFIQSWILRFETAEEPIEPFEASKNLVSSADPSENEIPAIYSSFRDSSEELDSSGYSQLFQTPSYRTGCVCQIGATDACFTQCTSVESRCGRTCLHVTAYSVAQMPSQRHFKDAEDDYVYSTYQTTSSIGCDTMARACIISTALAGAAIAAAIGAAVAVGVGVPANTQQLSNIQQEQELQVNEGVEELLASGRLFNFQIPRNDQPIPVRGRSFRDGGCGDNLVAFPDGKCYPVLRRGPCDDPFRWVTVDPQTLTGRCSPRLCGSGRVFVGRDGLCHDIYDPLECRGGRRLYYSAYGDPLCDCPVGQFPFPTLDSDCVPLFTRGPCREGEMVGFENSGALGCVTADCPSSPTEQLVRNENGQCLALGARNVCPAPNQFVGYDVFQNRGVCVDITDEDSPYFIGQDLEVDQFYNQIYPDYDDYRFIVVSPIRRNLKATRKQDTGGIFRFPFSLPDTLLNPCRPGQRNGNNFKCTNPLVTRARRLGLLQAVRSAFRCPADKVLQASGFCVNNTMSASCGPSYKYLGSFGECRQIFEN